MENEKGEMRNEKDPADCNTAPHGTFSSLLSPISFLISPFIIYYTTRASKCQANGPKQSSQKECANVLQVSVHREVWGLR